MAFHLNRLLKHMKCQVLFSQKKIQKEIKKKLRAAVVIGILRINMLIVLRTRHFNNLVASVKKATYY